MKVQEIVEKLNLKEVVICDKMREVNSAYCGDFLSFAISKQGDDCIWFTIMNNVNVAGVASLTDCALIVLCDAVEPDEMLKTRAQSQGINLAISKADVYNTAVAFSRLRKI